MKTIWFTTVHMEVEMYVVPISTKHPLSGFVFVLLHQLMCSVTLDTRLWLHNIKEEINPSFVFIC